MRSREDDIGMICYFWQEKEDIELWYDSNQLYGQYEGSRVQFKDLLEWMTEHQVELTTFLPKIK